MQSFKQTLKTKKVTPEIQNNLPEKTSDNKKTVTFGPLKHEKTEWLKKIQR
jgi:hypothetical protein